MAQRLVQDHTKANQELLTIAKQKDLSVPKEVDDTHEDVVKLFSRLEGAQFDREFLRYQVMHHEKDVAAFNLQAKEGQDPDLKAFAAKQLPVLKEYLQQARDAESIQEMGKAAVVFFTGGDRIRLTSQLGDPPVSQELKTFYELGARSRDLGGGRGHVRDDDRGRPER